MTIRSECYTEPGMHQAAVGNERHDVIYLLGSSAEVDLVRSVVTRGHAEVAAAAVPGVLERDGIRAASVELHIATRNGKQVGLVPGVTESAYLVHDQVTVTEPSLLSIVLASVRKL